MPPILLDSKLSDLEYPGPDELHIRVDIGPPPNAIAQTILRELGLASAG